MSYKITNYGVQLQGSEAVVFIDFTNEDKISKQFRSNFKISEGPSSYLQKVLQILGHEDKVIDNAAIGKLTKGPNARVLNQDVSYCLELFENGYRVKSIQPLFTEEEIITILTQGQQGE